MKKILIISWFYPPINSSEGLVTYKLLKNSEYEYDVFTQKKSMAWSYGNKETELISKNVKCIYGNSNSFEEWVKSAIDYFKKNLDKYDIVMSRSMPPESHKIGLTIKKICPNIKWIASFGDPLADNPYTKASITYASPYALKNMDNFRLRTIISPKRIVKNTIFNIRYYMLHRKTLYPEAKLQSEIIKKADHLIFNNQYQQEYMCKKEYKEKCSVLYHGYDEKLYSAQKEKSNHEKIKMVYIGHLDNLRTPILIFRAINDLKRKDGELDKKILLEFYGDLSDSDKLYIINHELTDIIHVKRPVSYLKSLQIMKDCDWLIHIDANLFSIIDQNIFFAAKLADYIGANNRIFAVTMQEGISADILKGINALTLSYSVEEIKNYLWIIIYEGYKKQINQEYRKNFDAINIAKKFDKLIKKI